MRCLKAGLTGVFDRSLRATHVYERDPAGFRRDAQASGQSLQAVHRLHPDLLPPLGDDFAWRDLPRGAGALVRGIARHRPVERVVEAAVALGGRARSYRLQRAAASLLWRAEQYRTARRTA